jgi:putative transcriptional regulator
MSKAGERLIQSALEALDIAEGKAEPAAFRIHVPEVLDVRGIREKTGLSQRAFAAAYGVPLDTLRGWEQGKRQPDGPSRGLPSRD